jgi:hypothetical protein
MKHSHIYKKKASLSSKTKTVQKQTENTHLGFTFTYLQWISNFKCAVNLLQLKIEVCINILMTYAWQNINHMLYIAQINSQPTHVTVKKKILTIKTKSITLSYSSTNALISHRTHGLLKLPTIDILNTLGRYFLSGIKNLHNFCLYQMGPVNVHRLIDQHSCF